MEYWIIYHLETGEPLIRGSGSAGAAALQQLPDGAGIVVVPQKVVAQPELDLVALRVAMAARVDQEAEALRMRYLTPGAGQAMTYTRKEAEARAWTVDSTAATPFLSAEATARGISLAQLAPEVIAQADAWVPLGAAIEAVRMGTKAAIMRAGSLGEIVAAASRSWPA
ncbi:hypothetical protein K7957_05045 [Sphingomonas yunnanensis]|uniref:hypothetical protein n=1 Tax=Sphingomonas yunnanensis TaxID=310400 RepID=UPI001CA6266D|nr:hypothetical protein [Sphingomonas yunnanensis]MBY9062295.1 hypothetical protein [Sphingomonas yunnanensis]